MKPFAVSCTSRLGTPDTFVLLQVTYLWLGYNKLGGNLPASWSTLACLKYWSMQSNQLTGTLPDSYSGMKSLVIFGAQSNQLVGTLPAT